MLLPHFKRYTTSSTLFGRPFYTKEWQELTEESQFAKSVGVISPKTLRLLTAYSKDRLEKIAREWNATEEQKEALHQSGLESVQRNWDRLANVDADYLEKMYFNGVNTYVDIHKKVVKSLI